MPINAIMLPPFPTWKTGETPAGQAEKVLEEAWEVVDAVMSDDDRAQVAYECMDVVQAICNLLHLLEIPPEIVWEAYRKQQATQIERGRL